MLFNPRFSWKIIGTGNNIMQTAYSIRVSTDKKFSSVKLSGNQEKLNLMNLFFRLIKELDLKSGQRYFWQVKIWDNKGKESKWSETAFWEMGLLSHLTGKQNGLKWKVIH